MRLSRPFLAAEQPLRFTYEELGHAAVRACAVQPPRRAALRTDANTSPVTRAASLR